MAACLALAEKPMPHLRLVRGGKPSLNLYRADGLRVWRRSTAGSTVLVTRSDYDGQMPVNEQQFQSGVHTWKRWNALGARGIDAFYNSTDSKWHYPIYDVHGNVKATLHRDGSTDYDTANWKQYDVWGGERASSGSGSMFGYCGNLGHPTDPENGLIYMRARFYEPWTGRFLSEDSANDGLNWYSYCASRPTSAADKSGNAWHPVTSIWFTMGALLSFQACMILLSNTTFSIGRFRKGVAVMALAVSAYLAALTNEVSDEFGGGWGLTASIVTFAAAPWIDSLLQRVAFSVMGSRSIANTIKVSHIMIQRITDYTLLCIAALIMIDNVGSGQ